MTAEIVEVGQDNPELWSSAVNQFKGGHYVEDDGFLSDPTTVALVAHTGDRLAGWAWGYRQIRPDGHTMLLLYELDVVAEEQRKGIGASLVEAFLELGQREGHRRMWVLTEIDNEAAIALYEATGGERVQGGKVSYQWELPQRR